MVCDGAEDIAMKIKPIKNEQDYRRVLKEIETLMDAKAATPDGDRLDVCVTLAEAWEAEIEHRLRAIDRGEVATVDWREAVERARNSLSKPASSRSFVSGPAHRTKSKHS